MSSIWTTARGPRHIRPHRAIAWRVIEGQHRVPTRKLVDDLEEQELLEGLLDRHKPAPPSPEHAHLHYLLYTPFRYPPLRHGSRFGTRAEPSLWYGAVDVDTALAERAYYRLLFLAGTTADLEPLLSDETAFSVPIETPRFVDLAAAPFTRAARAISAPDDYRASQALGRAMRAANVLVFAYPSARTQTLGICLGLFAPAFAAPQPTTYEGYKCRAARTGVELANLAGRVIRFDRAQFLVDGKLPAPAA